MTDLQPVAIRQRQRVVPKATLEGAKPLKWHAEARCFMGIDPSLTACGVGVLFNGSLKTMLLAPKKRGAERLAWFRDEFTHLFEEYRPECLAIEGYAYGSKVNREVLGELGGVLRLAAHDCRLPTIVVPPNSLKQFATGSGSGSKGVILKEAFKRFDMDVSDDNEADAGVLSLMAHAKMAGLSLTAFQQTAMTKASWAIEV